MQFQAKPKTSGLALEWGKPARPDLDSYLLTMMRVWIHIINLATV